MGHERVGVLPKTRRWRDIVASIVPARAQAPDVAELVADTLDAVRARFDHIHEDTGVQASFGYLLRLAHAAAEVTPSRDFPVDLAANPSPLQLARVLRGAVAPHFESHEYGELGIRAATDALTRWQADQVRQRDLFGPADARTAWSRAATAAGFCEVSRLFFSSFTERYLRYFLDREASQVAASIEARDEFAGSLAQHVDSVSRHAFDTAKITQSFAAGWYSKYADKKDPSARAVEAFLRIAFGKLREELRREAASG